MAETDPAVGELKPSFGRTPEAAPELARVQPRLGTFCRIWPDSGGLRRSSPGAYQIWDEVYQIWAEFCRTWGRTWPGTDPSAELGPISANRERIRQISPAFALSPTSILNTGFRYRAALLRVAIDGPKLAADVGEA